MNTPLRFAGIVASLVLLLLLLPAVALANDGIEIMKSADPSALSAPGDVAYTYTVTNTTGSDTPTETPIGDVTVSDDQIASVTYGSGDTDGDGLLDTDEAWVFSATSTLSTTTTNVGTVRGTRQVDQQAVEDSETVTVVVDAAGTTNDDTDTGSDTSADTSSTENGGELPKTASPWYDILALGGILIVLGGAGVWIGMRRTDA